MVGGWWLVVDGWWLVVGGWWLVVGGWWLVVVGGFEQLLRRNVKRFRGGLVSKAHALVYHLTLGSRLMKKKKVRVWSRGWRRAASLPAS